MNSEVIIYELNNNNVLIYKILENSDFPSLKISNY